MLTFQLRGNTYRLDFQHKDARKRNSDKVFSLRLPSGTVRYIHNITVAKLFCGDEQIASMSAYCSPLDNFNRAVGRKVALTKLLKETDFNASERGEIWRQYIACLSATSVATKAVTPFTSFNWLLRQQYGKHEQR